MPVVLEPESCHTDNHTVWVDAYLCCWMQLRLLLASIGRLADSSAHVHYVVT